MSVAVLVPRLLSAAQDKDRLRRPRQAVDVVEALEVLEVAFVPLVVSAFNGAADRAGSSGRPESQPKAIVKSC